MKFLLTICLIFIGLSVCGQEQFVKKIKQQDISEHIVDLDSKYQMAYVKIIPALSFIESPLKVSKHTLMVIDLSIDLRKQHQNPETSILVLPENKFIQSEYNVSLPSAISKQKSAITLTGGGGYNSNSRGSNGHGTIKNTVYKDASEYAVIYCPVTGVPLTY